MPRYCPPYKSMYQQAQEEVKHWKKQCQSLQRSIDELEDELEDKDTPSKIASDPEDSARPVEFFDITPGKPLEITLILRL